MTRWAALAVLALSLAPHAATARTAMTCLVSFEARPGAWSPPQRVEVEFYASRELFPDARDYPVYAQFWFNGQERVLVALPDTSLTLRTLEPLSLQRLLSEREAILGVELESPLRWRLRVKDRGLWVDPRYPEAFDPPIQQPPPRRR